MRTRVTLGYVALAAAVWAVVIVFYGPLWIVARAIDGWNALRRRFGIARQRGAT